MPAGTIAIGSAVATFFGSTALSAGTLFAIGFATQAALGLALNALTPKPSSSASSRGYQVTQRGTALDHQVIYGRMRTAGVVVHDEVTNDNKYLHRVIAFAGHEIEEFEEFWINGEKVTINSSGLVTASPWNSKVKIRLRRGESDQLAEPDLVAASGAGWSTNHRLRGIAYLYVRLEFDPDVFPNGVPEIQATIKGKKVYDPRINGHDPDDSSTWEWSDNPALCLSDYITSGYGLNEPRGNVDDGLVVTAANVCDEQVGGTNRYTCNGAFVTSVSPYNQLNDLLTSMGGLLWYAQGQWRMKPAYWVAPTLTFTEDDLRSSIAVQTRHSRRDNFNTVRGTFRGEESDWQVTDYPEYSNAAFVTADGGDESVADITLPFTDTAKEARRIARIALERNRQQLTVQASFGLRAFQVQVGDVINLSLERFGWDQKTFEVASWTFGLTDNQDLQVQMVLREISANVFDEVDDGIIYERDNTNLPNPFINVAPQNLVVSDGGFTTDDGTYVNSFIVDWDPPTDAFIDYYVLEWRKQGESVFKSVNLKTTDYQIAPVTDGITYDIRVKAINSLGVSGPYATTTATVGGDNVAPAAPTAISATGGFRYVTIDWTNPTDKDLSYVEVYENTSNSTSGASLVGEISGDQFVRTNLGINVTRWYFLKAVDYSGNKSGFTAGVSGTTTFLDDADYENGIRSLFEDQGLYAIEDVATLPASGIEGQVVFNRADGKLYRWGGTAWVQLISDVDLNASDIIGKLQTNQIELDAVTNDLIANNAVQSENIANLAILGTKLADNAVTVGKVANGAILEAKLADNAVTLAKVSDGAISEPKIATNAVTSTKISDGSISTPKIATNAITANKISSGSITTAKLAAGAVTANELAANSVVAGKIAAGVVTASEIAAGTITAGELAANSVTTAKIATGAITASEIATDTITANKIATGAITATELATNSVIASKISAGAVTAGKVAANAITANEIATGTITATQISGGTITGNKIAGNTITGNKISANTITGGLLATSGIITNTAQINNGLITNAKIANAAITTAKIANANITTAKIGDNQVTFPQFSSGVVKQTYSVPDSEKIIASITINQSGAPAWVFAEAIVTSSDTGTLSNTDFTTFDLRLAANGSTIAGVDDLVTAAICSPSFVMDKTNTTSGTVTYTLRLQPVGGTTDRITVLEASIFVVELKK